MLGVIGLYPFLILCVSFTTLTLNRAFMSSERALRRISGGNMSGSRKSEHVSLHAREAAADVEIWARGPAKGAAASTLRDLAGPDLTRRLRSLCGRCLYRTLTSYVRSQDHGHFTVVLTGDIPAVWLRDSAVQMATYIPRVARHPGLRLVLEGAIRAQAYFILQVRCWKRMYTRISVCMTIPY